MQVFKRTSRFGFYLLKEAKSRVRISENCYQNGGNLQESAMQRAEAAIGDFAAIARSYRAQKIICVATSALRDAPNRNLFINRVYQKHGVRIKVIDGHKEALYGGIAAQNLLPIQEGVTVDIGGGSTELALIQNGHVQETISFNLGTVRLKELFFDANRPIPEAVEYVKAQLQSLPKSFKATTMIGIGGTLRALASVVMKRERYPLSVLHGYTYPIEENRRFFEEIVYASEGAQLKALGFKQDRLDVIREGTLILEAVADLIGAEQIMTSGVGVREGVFLSDLLRAQNYRFPENFNPSVRSLMDRFDVDRKVAAYIQRNAYALFDLLAPLHNLDRRYREALGYAAKLCEIGVYINYYEHYVHGYHLLFDGLNYGFTHEERILISKVVKNLQKKAIIKYEPESGMRQLLPSIRAVKWMAYLVYVAQTLTKDGRLSPVKFRYDDEQLIIESPCERYIVSEALKPIKTPTKNLSITFKTLSS